MSQITKRALEESLKKLLAKKPLDKVTINDITEECGVSRMTFYYHFKDIYDLVEWSCQEDAAKVLEGKRTYANWQEGFLQIFELIRENKTFIMNVYRNVSREYVELYLYRVTYPLILEVLNEEAKDRSVNDGDKEFIARFYQYAFVGLLLEWIKDGMVKEPKQIIEKLSLVMQGNFSRALEAFSTKKFK